MEGGGASRFLLKHETADASLYAALHPGYTLAQRVDALQRLRRAGYEIGSGFIVGVPGQRPETLADDILLARELHVDMCGAGPFIPQADTPLGNEPQGSVELALRVMAVLRIALPWSNLPATTALASLGSRFRATGGPARWRQCAHARFHAGGLPGRLLYL